MSQETECFNYAVPSLLKYKSSKELHVTVLKDSAENCPGISDLSNLATVGRHFFFYQWKETRNTWDPRGVALEKPFAMGILTE